MKEQMLRGLGVAAIGLALFAAGLSAGTLLRRSPTPGVPASSEDVPGQVADEPAPVPADGTETPEPAEDDGETLGVNWFPVADQSEREFNFYLRKWWEKGNDPEEFDQNRSARAVGEITGGQWDGWTLVANTVTVSTMGDEFTRFYVIQRDKADSDRDAVLLGKYVARGGTWYQSLFGWARLDDVLPGNPEGLTVSMATIPAFEDQETIRATDGSTLTGLGFGTQEGGTYFKSLNNRVVAQTTDGRDLYLYDSRPENAAFDGRVNEVYFLSEDGRPVWYTLNVPFWEREGKSEENPQVSPFGVPAIRFGTEPQNESTYLRGQLGGCGFSVITNVDANPPALRATGVSVSDASIQIYEPSNHADPSFDEAYGFWVANNPDGTREQFAAAHPILYYKDAFGRWIMFQKSDVVPAVECGKPVIYLYPETTTDVSVELEPQGGFSKTEPAYGNGWNVTASPDGSLVNATDGKTYPYLFWEGRGGYYESPRKYWVVPRDDVHAFLGDTLAKLGLNAQETKDFLEFWEPRMRDAAYYKIGFHGTSVMDALAPMEVSPRPDTVLRVLMDYEELDRAIPSDPPVLPPAPSRDGFTVIEWGGVLR